MGIGRIKMAVNIPCLNVQVIVIVIVIVQVTSFVINVIRMRPSLDVVEENKALERQTTASVQLCCKIIVDRVFRQRTCFNLHYCHVMYNNV